MKQLYSIILFAATLASCHHVYYAPNTANAPMLSEKGETRVNALYTVGMDSEFGGAELQGAYAVSNHIGIMVNGITASKSSKISNINNSSTHREKGSGTYIEAAAGYFKKLDAGGRVIGDIYAGLGTGSIENVYAGNESSKVGITKFFLQPSFGYKARKFEAVFVPKLSLINWKVKNERLTLAENNSDKNAIAAIKADPDFFAFEPTFLLRAGSEDVKLQIGLTFSRYDPTSFFDVNSITETLNANIGLSFNFRSARK